jgi:phage N-6-adenine-methyltransferase
VFNKEVMFSSKTDMWSTPPDFFNRLDAVFHFGTDVCATPDNAKCSQFFDPEQDGLKQPWLGTCWMNPPYGRGIDRWVKRAYEQSKAHGSTIICLLPARTDTKWWHDYCVKGEVTYLKGRLKFGAATASAPFPSAVVVFRPQVSDILGEA